MHSPKSWFLSLKPEPDGNPDWMFTRHDRDEMADLNEKDRRAVRAMLDSELAERAKSSPMGKKGK